MDTIGYVVTNKFIIIAAEGWLKITIKNSDDTSQTLNLDNARKIYTIGNQLAISVLGIPTKITDIYNYVLNLKYGNQTFDSILDDLKSIYNTDPGKLISNLETLLKLVTEHTSANNEVDKTKLTGILKNDPDALTMLHEAITLQNSVGATGLTKILLFGHENNRNVFGDYKVLGFNIVGSKIEHIEKDHVFFNIQSSIIKSDKLQEQVNEKLDQLQQYIISGWEDDPAAEKELYTWCCALLTGALFELNGQQLPPNFQLYVLNKDTNYEFLEPEAKLTNISFNR